MRKMFIVLPLLFCLVACTSTEQAAYNALVGAKAFLDSTKRAHPECSSSDTGITVSAVCQDLIKATAAKDLIADALTIYCSGPAFQSGGACQPPAKGTSAFTQAQAALQAAVAGYNQTAADLKGVL